MDVKTVGIEPQEQMDVLGNEPDPTAPPLLEIRNDFGGTMDDEMDPSSFEPELVPTDSAHTATNEVVRTATTPKATKNEPTRQVTSTQCPTREHKQVKSHIPSMSGKSYEYAATQLATTTHELQIVEMVLTQLTLNAAIKKWGQRATGAAKAEMKQLHWQNTFKPVHYQELTANQKVTILESHRFLKEKCTGEINGCTVAGGNKQCGYIEKEDATSPTVSTESVILVSFIDVTENCDLAVIDVPKAFIQIVVVDKKRQVIVRIRGMLVDKLVRLAPKVYGSYVTIDKKGNKQ
jgi:hypothetical protein